MQKTSKHFNGYLNKKQGQLRNKTPLSGTQQLNHTSSVEFNSRGNRQIDSRTSGTRQMWNLKLKEKKAGPVVSSKKIQEMVLPI